MAAEPARCPCCGAALVDDGTVRIDFSAGLIVANARYAALTRAEFSLFAALWNAKPRMMSKVQLLEACHLDFAEDDRDLKIVDVYVCKIRKKLAPLGVIVGTVWGQGYRVVPPGAEANVQD